MAARFVTSAARAMLLLEEIAAATAGGTLGQARQRQLAEAIAYLRQLEEDWCGGQGGSSFRVQQAISSWQNANSPQAKSLLERTRAVAKGLDGKPTSQWTAAEWALVGAIIVAAVASELIPTPL